MSYIIEPKNKIFRIVSLIAFIGAVLMGIGFAIVFLTYDPQLPDLLKRL